MWKLFYGFIPQKWPMLQLVLQFMTFCTFIHIPFSVNKCIFHSEVRIGFSKIAKAKSVSGFLQLALP